MKMGLSHSYYIHEVMYFHVGSAGSTWNWNTVAKDAVSFLSVKIASEKHSYNMDNMYVYLLLMKKQWFWEPLLYAGPSVINSDIWLCYTRKEVRNIYD